MKQKKIKTFAIVAGVFIVIAALIAFNQPALIYGGTGTMLYDNNQQAWVIDAYLNNLDTDPAQLIFSTTEMQSASKKQGSELIPKDSETVVVALSKKDCIYTVEPLYAVAGNGYYKVYNPQLDFEIKASAKSTGNYQRIPLSSIQPSVLLNNRNGGQVTLSSAGVELQKYCYIPDNARVIKLGSTFKVLDADRVSALQIKYSVCNALGIASLVTCFATGVIDIDDALDSQFYRDSGDIRFEGTILRTTPNTALANVHVIITADREYFNAEPVAVQPETATPKILDVICPSKVSSGLDSSVKVVVKNIGKYGAVQVQADSGQFTFTSPTTQASIQTNEQKTFYIPMSPISVTKDTAYRIDIYASSQQQLGTGAQDTAFCTGTVTKQGILPPKEYCGNDICEANENYQTCAKDCKVELCDPQKLEILNEDTGRCVCVEGFVRNDEGMCVESTSDDLYFYALLAVIVFAIIAIILSHGKKKGNIL